jgi:uncharacterized protein with PQ loop repeat
MSDPLAITAASWGILMAISPLLQIRRMLQTRSSDDLSLGYLAVLLVGFGLWIAYGVSLANMALIIPNSVALLVGLVTLGVALRFRRDVAGG